MNEIRYMISDAAKKVDVEAHVLRYWEEELELPIQRNEMGHRYYTEENIERLKKIKEMKDNGFQLKAIKMVLKNGEMSIVSPIESEKEEEEESMDNVTKLTFMLKKMLLEVLEENNAYLIHSMEGELGDRVIKEMNYLFREQEEKEEERYKKLDELIRYYQKEGKEKKEKKEKKRLFSFKKRDSSMK
ncbi:MerR family transcriptional regulator [bacterium 1XD42-8]|nr:MerR family transcriptional regulator [Lachnospiraceae bacterium]RKJ53985.1 MerR family transcriptional regulator [bacterium 1XD42-8]